MTPHYSVQARLIERRQGVIVRNETRLDTTAVLEDAVREGRRHAADGFTVWIYRVEQSAGSSPRYVTVETLAPRAGPKSAASDPRTGPTSCPP